MNVRGEREGTESEKRTLLVRTTVKLSLPVATRDQENLKEDEDRKEDRFRRNALLGTLVGPSLRLVGGEDSVAKGRGGESEDDGDETHSE